ncbi:hypothetical protein BB561_000691 [Smittium simulii]|uniref:Peptidase S1 domain-containing protein n=1 Tax=Smittium simulii TaxID=133385 RepID=A0A2T9YY25_9FUNG|nr:hypothetical protein BB561_000691 [Smittium simulii]
MSSAPFGLWNTCGGTLIAPNVIVTLATCLVKIKSTVADPAIHPSQLSILVGSERTENSAKNIFKASKFIFYPGYRLEVYRHNIALIVLEKNVPQNLASPISLYDQPITDDLKVRAVGWGATTSNNEKYSTNLNYIDLNISSIGSCGIANSMWSTNNGMNICTVNREEKGVCFGDFGGPLVTAETTPAQLVGVIDMIESQNINENNVKCGTRGALTYHTNVRLYSEWINQNIRENIIA